MRLDYFRRFPHFRQFDTNDCGPACLKIIFDYYQLNIPFSEIRNKSKLDWKGANLFKIESIAKEYAFRTISVSVKWEKIAQEGQFPAIFMINQNHYVVVYKVDKRRVHVSDPAIGRLKYKISDFRNIWETVNGEGIALLLRPSTETFEIKATVIAKNRHFSNKVYTYIKSNTHAFGYIFAGLILGSLLQLILPFSTQIIIDEGIKNKNLNLIMIICAGQFIFIFSRSIIDLIRRWLLIHLATIFNISLLQEFLLKIIRLPLAYFEFRSFGDLLQRMEDHKKIDRMINSSSLNASFSIISFVLYGVILLIYSKIIFLFYLLFSIIFFSYNIGFTKFRKILDYKRFQRMAESSDSVFQIIFGINEIKIYQAEHVKVDQWKKVQNGIFEINVKSARLASFQSVGSLLLSEGKNFALLFYCSVLVINGQLTLGMMFTVQYIVGLLNVPLQDFITFLNDYVESKMAYDRIVDIYDYPDEQPELLTQEVVHVAAAVNVKKDLEKDLLFNASYPFQMDNLKSKPRIKPLLAASPEANSAPLAYDLRVENAGFTYKKSYANDDNAFQLKNINFTLNAGKKTAIVGASGSGKTTLLKLILRFYPFDSGHIFLDDSDFYKIPVDEWRSLCSPVLQDGYIFSDTVANNIALGDVNPKIEDVEKAAKLAEIYGFIDALPSRFETFIGGNGHGLSQGQKQRILIARAIYKNSPFFLFDEATSSLDSLNEHKIMENIYNNLDDKTMLIIAHRLSTVVRADEILVMDKGEIVERGTHVSLINDRGIYYELVRNQIDLVKE